MYTHKIGFISLSMIGVAAVLMVVTAPPFESSQALAVSQPMVKKISVKDPPSKAKKDPPRRHFRHPAFRHPAFRHPAFRHPAFRHPAFRHPAFRHPGIRPPIGSVRPPTGIRPPIGSVRR